MYSTIMLLSGIFSLMIFIVVLVSWPDINKKHRKQWLTVAFALLSICVAIITTDQERSVNIADTKVEYAQVKNVGRTNINLDGVDYKIKPTGAVATSYPIDCSTVKVGDIVKFEYLVGDVGNYLIKIEKVK
jgi:hypothetical protein